MFTGLIEETGTLKRVTPKANGLALEIAASKVIEGLRIGDSIAVDGVCLTVIDFCRDSFTVEAVSETVENSTMKDWQSGGGKKLNLERALAVGDRLGGHIVQGHVDSTGTVKSIQRGELETEITISADTETMRFIVRKGSIALNGISLTVADEKPDCFTVAVIPHTLEATNLGELSVGGSVNLETDIFAKYIAKFMTAREDIPGVTEESLRNAGF